VILGLGSISMKVNCRRFSVVWVAATMVTFVEGEISNQRYLTPEFPGKFCDQIHGMDVCRKNSSLTGFLMAMQGVKESIQDRATRLHSIKTKRFVFYTLEKLKSCCPVRILGRPIHSEKDHVNHSRSKLSDTFLDPFNQIVRGM
jgi:hypothetical protein